MALIVEDGSIVPGAEVFASVTWMDDWLDRRGLLLAWNEAAGGLEDKEAAAREAVDYLRGQFRWKGRRVSVAQALDFPRARLWVDAGAFDATPWYYNSLGGYLYGHGGVYLPSDEVPAQVMAAQALLAYERVTGGRLLPSWSGAPVRSKRAGGVQKDFGGQGDHPARHFPEVASMLAGLYESGPRAGIGGSVLQLVRA